MNVVVLIADIIGSKKIGQRAEFQRNLKGQLEEINTSSGPSLLSPYTITLGDEFQAVYGAVDTIFADLMSIVHAIHPVQVRCALSYGALSTDINTQAALEMDGPAFYAARRLIDGMKQASTDTIQVTAPDLPAIQLMNGSLRLMGNVIAHLSRNNLTVLRRLMAGASTKDIAAELSVTPRAVNKGIARHALDDVVQLIRILTEEFEKGMDLRSTEEASR